MSGFLYFKPGKDTATLDLVKEWGLGYAFSASVTRVKCVANSPTGTGGITFSDRNRMGESETKMDMPNQTWAKIPKSDVWVGYWNDAPPKPEELARPNQLPGYYVPLADEQKWLIPLVRRFDQDGSQFKSALPSYMDLDDDGNWVDGKVLDIHAHLWELTTPFADELFKANAEDGYEPRNFTANELGQTITTLLQTNYVVGPGELRLMKALTNEANTKHAILFACEVPVFLEWLTDQKKSNPQLAQDGLSTIAGEAA
jgi:hypothetical protein